MADEIAFSIEGTDGSSDDVTIPADLLDVLAEDDDETPAEIVGDLALFSCVQRVHSAVHHAQDEPDPELVEIEEHAAELFEERFGATFAELTGHSH